ncbi:MAG: YggU family protein [Thermoflexales bacterium]|nr:YggU family protein [Thermoflexales bacterium]
MERLKVQEGPEGCTFGVHVAPGSRQDAVVGLYGDALRVRLRAPATEGKANQTLRAFLAGQLGVSVDAVEILSGHTSRHKVVRVAGVTAERVCALLRTD